MGTRGPLQIDSEQTDVDRPGVLPKVPAEQTMQLGLGLEDVLYVPRGHGRPDMELQPAGQ